MTRFAEGCCRQCGLPVSAEAAVTINGGVYHPFCGRRKYREGSSPAGGADPRTGGRSDRTAEERRKDRPFRHLLDTRPGDEVWIRRIPYEPIRGLCRRRGLEPGVRLRVQDRDRREVRVRLPGGRLLGVEVHVAQLLEVDSDGPRTLR